MRILAASFVALSVLATCALGCTPPDPGAPPTAAAPQILPLRSLRLYETGVGYFERSGTMAGRGGSATSLPVPAGHLDDAIASLVVLNGGGGGQVTGVAFTSSVTRATARSRAGLPADPNAPITFEDLLSSMKGSKVSVFSRNEEAAMTGRVVEVTTEVDHTQMHALALNKEGKQPDQPPRHLVVTLLTESGAVAIVAAEDIIRIRPVDQEFATRLDAALDAVGSRAAQNTRALRLLGETKGQVTFGYIAETPIWRTSYRLILDTHTDATANSAQLQGWALLHNDTDENWHDVHLELVNGEPDSFVFPMAAPRYARRDVIHPDEPLSTMPQLQDTTADALWGDNLDGHGSGSGTGQGFGSGHGRLGGSHMAKAPQMRMGMTTVNGRTRSSSLLDVGNLAELAQGAGVEQGALFVYAMPSGFSLDAHASALLPFLQKSVSVENLAFFGDASEKARAAVRFVNGTGQTLPSGTISVFGAGGFTGETALDRLKPGERRFLQIGNDLDAELTVKKVSAKEEPKRLTFENDALEEHFLRTTEHSWELENRSGSTRTFYVGMAVDRNAKITGSDRNDFDEQTDRPTVIFDVKSKQKVVKSFTVVEGLSRSTTMDSLTEKVIKAFLLKTTIPAAELTILQQALPRAQALEQARTQVTAADAAIATVDQDLERLREDMKALGGGSAATGGGAAATPLVKRVVDAEDRVGVARKNKEAAEKTLDDRREALRLALAKLAPKPAE